MNLLNSLRVRILEGSGLGAMALSVMVLSSGGDGSCDCDSVGLSMPAAQDDAVREAVREIRYAHTANAWKV